MTPTKVRTAVVAIALGVTGTRAPADDVPFTERVISTGADGAFSAFAADVDGDGDTDVLSASRLDDTIAWYENDGGSPPSFTARVISTTADEAYSVFAADVDGDGDIDVISASRLDDKVAWYQNNGASPPAFTERVISTAANEAVSVFAADVDGDGDTDVLSASALDDTIAWYENDGAFLPGFTARVISTTADVASSVFAADVDGDGDTDVLSASQADDTIAWYENDGGSPPAFTERTLSTTADGAASVFAADVDGDGDTDIVAASALDGTIAWYDNERGSPPVFTRRVIATTADEPLSVFAADVDGDGQTDVLSASQADDTIAWYENGSLPPGDVPFVERVISTTADGATSVFAADVDGDGDTDVLSASANDDTIAWYESDGAFPPAFTEHVITTTADFAFSVFAADVDGDGDVDVLAASGNDDTVAAYINDGMSTPGFIECVISSGALDARSVFAADVDGDGDTDVLSASLGDDTIAWYENVGGCPPPGSTEHVISTAADGAFSVFAADVDVNGWMDVLSASRLDDTIALYWHIPGTLVFDEITISTARDAARSVFAADLDDDGDLDVLAASSADDTIAWYENNGLSPPMFPIEHVISTERDGAAAVFAADVNRDGSLDVIVASSNDDTVAWYESDGGSPPAFTEHVISAGADNARSVFAVDLDGDGDVDVLSASEDDDTIAWYENGRTDVAFDAPLEVLAAGEATYAAVGNLDTSSAAAAGTGTRDVVALLPNADTAMDGQAQIFRNPAGDGQLVPNEPIDTGADPTGVDVGFFNADLYLDFALTSATDGTVVVYVNDATGLGGFPEALRQTVLTVPGGDPRAIATDDFDGDAHDDLVVAFQGDGTVRLLFGDGSLGFVAGDPIPIGGGMTALEPGDLDDDDDCDVVLTNDQDDVVTWIQLNLGKLEGTVDLSVGDAPVDVALGDLDGQLGLDIATADSGDATISVLLNMGGGVFAPRFTLHTGDNPRAVHAADLDGDGDLELAVVATDPELGPVVQVFENTTVGGAADQGGGALFFADPMTYDVEAAPNFVTGGDFNGDGLSDLVTANADDGGTGGSVTVLLAVETPRPCGLEDIDDSGDVGFSDLLALLARWGFCPGCPQDLDGDEFVGFSDLLVLLGAWGPCL